MPGNEASFFGVCYALVNLDLKRGRTGNEPERAKKLVVAEGA